MNNTIFIEIFYIVYILYTLREILTQAQLFIEPFFD